MENEDFRVVVGPETTMIHLSVFVCPVCISDMQGVRSRKINFLTWWWAVQAKWLTRRGRPLLPQLSRSVTPPCVETMATMELVWMGNNYLYCSLT